MQITENVAYIGLGANLGNASQTIRNAFIQLGQLLTSRVTRASSLYSSAPIAADGDDYVNAVVELHTQLNPSDLLLALQALELQFGRTRDYLNAPRTLDLDLLLYAHSVIDTENLQVPHPRMMHRAFVLVPLLEISPQITIPNHGPAQTWHAYVKHQTIRKIGEATWPVI